MLGYFVEVRIGNTILIMTIEKKLLHKFVLGTNLERFGKERDGELMSVQGKHRHLLLGSSMSRIDKAYEVPIHGRLPALRFLFWTS
jgi:hypothetical protein